MDVFPDLAKCTSILLLFFARARGQDYGVEEKKCDIVVFNHKYYDRQILFGGYGKAFHLFFHELSGDLFFSHASRKQDLHNRQILVCNSQKNYCANVKGINNGYTIAYDENTDEIFFGAADGIYVYDFLIHKATLVAAKGIKIWDIFIFANYFYYVVHSTKRLYVVKNYNFEDVTLVVYTEVDHFHATEEKETYISNRTGLYKFSESARKLTVLVNNTDIQIRQISHDSDNKVYFCGNDGIYKFRKRFRRVMRIRIKSQLYGMTVVNLLRPRNNLIVIYSDEKNIYRLLPSDDVECINDYIAKRKRHYDKKLPKNETFTFSLEISA